MRKDTSSSSLMSTMMDEIFPIVAKSTQETKNAIPTFVELASGILMCKQGETSYSKGLIYLYAPPQFAESLPAPQLEIAQLAACLLAKLDPKMNAEVY